MLAKQAQLGWPPRQIRADTWHQQLDAALASFRPSQARAFVQATRASDTRDLKPIRLAVLRNFSLELSEALLQAAFLRWGVLLEITWFDYDCFEAPLIDPDSVLQQAHAHSPFDCVLLAWRLKHWIPTLWAASESDQKVLAASLHRVQALLTLAMGTCRVLCLPFDTGAAVQPHQQALIEQHQAVLASVLSANHAQITMVALAAPLAEDAKMEQVSGQPFTLQAQVALSCGVARAAARWFALSAKVLVLDADNTLWGGVLGEDGMAGVDVDPRYQRLQTLARDFNQQGVLLALLSKNELTLVQDFFASAVDMPLAWQDFSAHVVNWQDKATGIQRIAAHLKVGLDSLVLLDDSRFERESVRAAYPQVLVPEVTDIDAMLDYLETGCDFVSLGGSVEDALRVNDYAANPARCALAQQAASKTDFLCSLALEAQIARWQPAHVSRIAQLFQKTNQFNLTTKRYTHSRLAALSTATDWHAWALSAQDKFAQQGLVGCVLVHVLSADVWEIDSFLLSCRALGRSYEQVLLRYVLQQAAAQQVVRVTACFVPTAKNTQVAEFYAEHGGEVVSTSAQTTAYQFVLSKPLSASLEANWVKLVVLE